MVSRMVSVYRERTLSPRCSFLWTSRNELALLLLRPCHIWWWCRVERGKVLQQQAVHEGVPTTDAPQQNTSGGLLQKLWRAPGEGMDVGEQQTDDVVAQDRQATA